MPTGYLKNIAVPSTKLAVQVWSGEKISIAFKLYILLVISYFLHMAARIPALGIVRFDMMLALMVFLLITVQQLWKNYGTRTERMIGILMVYVVVTVLFVKWPGSVLHAGIPNLLKVLAFFYFTISLVNTEKKLRIFLTTFLVCQVIRVLEPVCLHVTTGYWGSTTNMGDGIHMDRLSGAPDDIINPNGLAFVIVTILPFLFYQIRTYGKVIKIVAWTVILPILIYALVLTASRSGFVAFGFILFITFLKAKRKAPYLALIVVAAMIGAGKLSSLEKERYLSLVRSDVHGAETAEGRMDGIVRDFGVGLERPIFGHGLGTSKEALFNAGHPAQPSHDLFTEVLIELGVFGLWIFGVFAWSIVRNFNDSVKAAKKNLPPGSYLRLTADATQTWIWMNLLFSVVSYGLSSYEWYLFGSLSIVLLRLTEKRDHKTLNNAETGTMPSANTGWREWARTFT